ncbi:hypothetical protein MFLAVUS_009426 [Mucor flavus]|uniref:Uncharacterized protein n=1 Tax=Mucor flavus TaxID=439312 RepID=A0ABP9Z9Z9_9FUNG
MRFEHVENSVQEAIIQALDLTTTRIKNIVDNQASFSSDNYSSSSVPVQRTDKDAQFENDDVFVDGYSQSIGTIIKSSAILIRNDLANEKPMSSRDAKIMSVSNSNGLSPILDLNGSSVNPQRFLFDHISSWEQLKITFLDKHPLKMTITPTVSFSVWKIVINV